MKKFVFLFSCLLFNLNLYSQTNVFQWAIGGYNVEFASSIAKTNNGGFIIGASTQSFGVGGVDAYLVRTNSNGVVVWAKTFGGGNLEFISSALQTNDSGFVFVGETRSFGAGDYDVLLTKVNSNGNFVWGKTYGGTNGDNGSSVKQTTDGGYIICGTTYSFTTGNGFNETYLIKTNASGDTLWTRTYGGLSSEGASTVQQTFDGGYILSGFTQSFGLGSNSDVYVVKTDQNGDTLWSKTYGSTDGEGASDIKQTRDSGYVVVGTSYGTGTPDMYVIRTKMNGDTLWTRTYGGTGYEEASSVLQTADGGFAITGYTGSFGAGNYDMVILKIDSLGNVLWSNAFGGTDQEQGSSIVSTNDTGFAVIGYTRSFGFGNQDLYLVKTDSIGQSDCNGTSFTMPSSNIATIVRSQASLMRHGGIVNVPFFGFSAGGSLKDACLGAGVNNEEDMNNFVKMYPNPFQSEVILEIDPKINFDNAELKLYDVLGKEVMQVKISEHRSLIKRNKLSEGIYFYRLFSDDKIIASGKLIAN